MREEDPYEVLGVSRDASHREIKRAWRRKARELHPDVNPADDAAEAFKRVQAAWEALSDSDRRRRHDRAAQARAEGRIPRTFLADFTDAVERAEALVFEALLPRYVERYQRGAGAEVAAALSEAVVEDRLDDEARGPEPGWWARFRARRLAKRIGVFIEYGLAWERVHTRRAPDGWQILLYPDAYWRAGTRDPLDLDRAVALHLATAVAAVLAAEADFAHRLGESGSRLEAARARDDAWIRRRRRRLAFWALVVLASACLLYAGHVQL